MSRRPIRPGRAQQDATTLARHHRKTPLALALHSALICLGVATAILPAGGAFAESAAAASAAAQTYNISAGPLQAALNQFATQAGIKLSFDAAEVQGLTTQGLNGSFTPQTGLAQLLAGSGLQAAAQGDGYVVHKTASASAASEKVATLPLIEVSAKDIDGYVAKNSTTGTRTNTPLRDVPQSISVVTQDLIKDQAMQNIADVVRYMPGIGMAQGEGNRETPIFRGNSSTSDFYIDGMRDDVQYFRDLYNIDRVEGLKGPNGMIFGRGGSGGVINRVSKEAGWDSIREISLQAGSWDHKRAAIDIGQGINDVAAFRLNAMYENSGSYRNGVDLKRHGINPTLTFKPGDRTKVAVGVEYFKDDRIADRGIPSFNGRPVQTDPSTFFGNPGLSPTGTTVRAFNALIEHTFDNELTLRNRTRYADYEKFYQNVFANGPVKNDGTIQLGAYNNATERDNFFNQTDFLYSLETGSVKHELLAGIELGHQVTDNLRQTGTFNGSSKVTLSNPISTTPITFSQSATDANNHGVAKIAAVYVQDQIKFTPQFEAVVGLRHDSFKVDFRNNRDGSEIHTNDSLLSPRVGLIYKPIEPLSLYASYSLAYLPRAGEQLASLTATNQAFDPEKFKNLEVGAKWDIRPSLAFTAAVYQLDRSNVAVPDPNNSAVTILVDGQRSKGVELGLSGRITSAWSVMGGYAYQEGEITQTQSASAKAGATLAQLPRHTFSLWNRYDINPIWGVGLGVISRSDMFASTSNLVTLPGYTRVDGAIFARLSRNVRVQLNIENLFDRKYALSAHNDNNITPGSPRAGRVTLIANF